MDDIGKILPSLPIFSKLDEATLQKISHGASLKNYQKGKILFIHGDNAERFFLIKSGWVKLFRETLDGAQAVVDILPQGHIFGETSLFENDTYPYSAEVIDSAEIISLQLSNLKSEIASNNVLALNMLRAMARYRRQQDQEIEHRSTQNASQRIGCFLLRLINQDNPQSPVIIHLPYDKTLLASRLGMQPETFSRALSKLKQKTGIRVKGATIEMDSLDQLVNYSCAACSSDFPCQDLKAAE